MCNATPSRTTFSCSIQISKRTANFRADTLANKTAFVSSIIFTIACPVVDADLFAIDGPNRFAEHRTFIGAYSRPHKTPRADACPNKFTGSDSWTDASANYYPYTNQFAELSPDSTSISTANISSDASSFAGTHYASDARAVGIAYIRAVSCAYVDTYTVVSAGNVLGWRSPLRHLHEMPARALRK